MTGLMITGSPVAEIGVTAGYQFFAFAQFSNLTNQDVTTTATWTSSNTQIASFTYISGRPMLSTFRAGTITVTATYGGKTATMTVRVA